MMQKWFTDAKLGIFIHWGIYAVKGIPESWSMLNGEISAEDYYSQYEGFTGENYDPQKWAELFKKSGARYAVLTSKHHDGAAMYDTKVSEDSVVKKSPFGRDAVAPYVEALRKNDLKVGLYFSHTDWKHDGHFKIITGFSQEELNELKKKKTPFHDYVFGEKQKPAKEGLEKDWEDFLTFHRSQLKEVLTNYGPLDLLWFDVMVEKDHYKMDTKDIRDLVHSIHPETVINSRLGEHGDYRTPEQTIPVVAPDGPWEYCMTINDSWGFQGQDHNNKSLYQIICYFVECFSRGGNLLLDVGPRADGTIPEEQIELLEGLGRWNEKHNEAVFEADPGLPSGHLYGCSTVSRDKKTLYAFLFSLPRGAFSLKGINNNIKKVSVLGNGTECTWKNVGGAPWLGLPGTYWIDVPAESCDENVTVVKIELEGELDYYHGEGKEIGQN